MATIMITIQAVMNPIGIMIGWLLSNQGDLVQGIFESVSAGKYTSFLICD
jgi:zinc transporter 1/2/3